MFGTTFCQMENSLLMTLTALLLLGVREGTFDDTNITTTTSSTSTTHVINHTTSIETPCPKTIHYITQSVLARLRVRNKESACEGWLYLYYPNQSKVPLCYSKFISNSWWSELCKDMRCGDFKELKMPVSKNMDRGLELLSNMTLINRNCSGLQISCEDTLGSELAAYKAIIGIFIFLMLGVILVKYSRPTYKAIRKRFSQKRQNRWIGPTQSQSVSYHRGQGPPNNNTLKRQSFPGLERLTVNTSREPSSNRNSDYDSYSYN